MSGNSYDTGIPWLLQKENCDHKARVVGVTPLLNRFKPASAGECQMLKPALFIAPGVTIPLRKLINSGRVSMNIRLPTAGISESNSDSLFPTASIAGRLSDSGGTRADSPGTVRKLDYDGQPVKGNPRIAPVVVHNGFIYVSGQGANDNGPTESLDIATHVRKVMDNVKKLVEAAGGDMDNVLQLTVYLSTLEFYEEMNKAYRPYFPNRGPARATVSVAGIPGGSLVEISCIARVVKP
jgi:2-iminobutanoate/2-iminopropanoate deaminase